jgi:hypothetical protein
VVRQAPDDLAGDAERRDPRHEREAGDERASPQALLEVLREREEQRVVGAGRRQQRHEAPGDGRAGDDADVHERRAAASGDAALHAGEPGERGHARRQGDPRPRRPPLGAAEDERDHDEHDRRGERRDAGDVDLARRALVVGGQMARGGGDHGRADRRVDEEDRAPPGARQVERDEPAAGDLADHRARRERERVQADGASALGAREAQLDAGQRLGEHQRGAGALQDARADEHRRRRRQAAEHGRGGEDRHAEYEDPPVAVGLAEPCAGDQQRREGDHVAADDELERRARGAEVGADRGGRDVGDRRVGLDHERAHEQDREQRALVGMAIGGHALETPRERRT